MPLILTREDGPRRGAARAVFDPDVYPGKAEVRGDEISVNPGVTDGEDLRMACVQAMESALCQGFEAIRFSARDNLVTPEALAEAVKAAAPAFLENGWLNIYLHVPEPAPEEETAETVPKSGGWRQRLRRLFRRLAPAAGGGETPAPSPDRDEEEKDAFRSRLEEGFGPTLDRLQREKGVSDGELCLRANMSRRTLVRLREEKDYIPSRNGALALALGLGLSEPEARELLGRAGYVLSRSLLSDVILEDHLQKETPDIYALNETLFRCGLPVLGPED